MLTPSVGSGGRLPQRLLPALIIAMCATAIICLADHRGWMGFLDRKSYDALTVLRLQVNPTAFRAPIVLIALDDATLNDPDFRMPLVLWHERLGELLTHVAAARPAAIGLDYLLPPVLFDDSVPGYSAVWLRALASVRRQGVPFITGYMQLQNDQVTPHPFYLQLIGAEGLAFFNLTTDEDDAVRRSRLWFETEEGQRAPSFPYAIARAFDSSVTARFMAQDDPMVHIDFLHPSPAFPVHSLRDVSARVRAEDAAWLQAAFMGKIVLIGSTDTLTRDVHATPVSALRHGETRKLPGVLIQAHTINTLLGDRLMRQAPPVERAGLILLIAIAASLLAIFGRRICYAIGLPLLLVFWALVVFLAFLQGTLYPLPAGVAVLLLSSFVAVGWREYGMERDKRKLRALFARYLPEHVVDTLAVQQDDAAFFQGETRQLCILVSDVRGFTTFARDRSPQEVVRRLNEYFEAMTQAIHAEGGVVDKFIGDGILAFFGLTSTREPASVAGARAALAMQTALEQLNDTWQARSEPTFAMGVGLHVGEVMVGNIGSSAKSDFTIIGDAVNVASRLESQTKDADATILVSEAFQEDAKEAIVVEDKGVVAIRGHSSMHALQLIAVRDS